MGSPRRAAPQRNLPRSAARVLQPRQVFGGPKRSPGRGRCVVSHCAPGIFFVARRRFRDPDRNVQFPNRRTDPRGKACAKGMPSADSPTSVELVLPVSEGRKRLALASRDLRDGMSRHWLWAALAMEDIRLRYRGSVLGPFWLTLSTVIMIAALGTVYAELFS